MDERLPEEELPDDGYLAEALRAIDMGLFKFEAGPETEQILCELVKAIRQKGIALG